MTTKSTTSNSKPQKPAKPYPDFPLFAHASGRWCKKIRGKFCYFGKWDNWQAALEKYNRERDFLYAGEEPPLEDDEAYTVRDLCNRFVQTKFGKVETDEIKQRTFNEYRQSICIVGCLRLLDESI